MVKKYPARDNYLNFINESRSNLLDVVKALSILWICWYHVDQLILPINQQVVSIRTLASLGFAGVNVFILLSGFGLSLSMIRKMQNNSSNNWINLPWKDFFLRRFLRIYPLYIFAHIFFFITGALQGKYADMPLDQGFLLSITGLRVFLPQYFWYGPDAFWFIGLIIQLYLLFPILFWLLIKTGKSKFLIITFMACAISRLITINLENHYIFMLGLACNRLAEFSLGMTIAYSLKEENQSYNNMIFHKYVICSVFFAICLLWFLIYSHPIEWIKIAANDLYLAIASFSCLLSLSWLLSHLKAIYKILMLIGGISYSFYLLHSPPIRPAFSLLKILGIHNFYIFLIIYVSIIALLSYFLTYLESKTLQLILKK